MKSFAFYAVALLALTALAAQARAQDDVEAQTYGIIKISATNNVITLAQLNRAVSKYATYTSITGATNSVTKTKTFGAQPTLAVNTTANTITVTFPNGKGIAFITVTGNGTLGSIRSPFFSRNATSGVITGAVKVLSTRFGKSAETEDTDAQTTLYMVSTPRANNVTVTVAQMNAGPIKAYPLRSVTAVSSVFPRGAVATVAANGTAISITGVPATSFLKVTFSGVVTMNVFNKQNRTWVPTPVNKSFLMLKVKLN